MKKRNPLYFLLTLLAFYFQINVTVFANNVSTEDPTVIPFPNIIINRVGFKDSKNDWVELYIIDDNNSGKGTNIKGMKVADDSAFLSITNELIVNSGDYLLINFNLPAENFSESGNIITYNIKKSGLTGTTEQVIIKNSDNEITDAVCWANSSPTVSETSDFNEIVNNNQWTAGIQTCLNSEQVKSDFIIARKNLIDTSTQNDWQIKDGTIIQDLTATPEPEISDGENEEEEEEDDDDESALQENSLNTCEKIIINEIFPNPKGSDTGNEWIELYNKGEDCVMDAWEIDDAEGGSKPFNINNQDINKTGFLLLPSWKTKITLNNSNESVRLFNPEKELVDEISFKESAKEDASFSRNEKDEFVWTKNPTPLGTNIFETEDETDDNQTSKKTTSKTVKNGDLSDKIHITELMPNPSGTDKGNEWVEIYNESEEEINLGGWTLDTGESSTKNYIFDNSTIKSKNFLVLSDSDLGISLKNTNGVLRLVDFENTVIDTIEYDNAADNSSYMSIKTINGENEETEWKWTENTTKGEENPVLYKYSGEIINFDQQKSELSLKTEETTLVILVEASGDEIMNISFKNGTQIDVSVKKNEAGELLLEDYEILSQPDDNTESGNSGILYILLSSLPPAGFLGFFGLKKFGIIKF